MSTPQTRLRARFGRRRECRGLLAATGRPGPDPVEVHGPAAALGQVARELAIAAA